MDAHLCAMNAVHEDFRKPAMTNKQRLIYSLLIALAVLAIMLGLSHLQNSGVITEKTFQYIAIAVAVLVVVINGIMRRKVKH
jgi:predicted tellurium resistance membrane protein TerC